MSYATNCPSAMLHIAACNPVHVASKGRDAAAYGLRFGFSSCHIATNKELRGSKLAYSHCK